LTRAEAPWSGGAAAQTLHSITGALLRGVRMPTIVAGATVLAVVVLMALLADVLFTLDPILIDAAHRLRPPGADHWLGTDALGRDIYSRVVYGARTSLSIGFGVACVSVLVGVAIALPTGYFRSLDVVVMRIMDGLMAIPTFLLAIALVALSKASLGTIILALSVPEIPRVVRLARSVVLTTREEAYVEAARTLGTSVPAMLWRHILPSTVAPLLVLASYICSSAILVEAALSFLGVGLPPEIPSWGGMIAQGRLYLQIAPWMELPPGIALTLTILAVNLVGDGLRDLVDPRLARKV
jgi:peptide/nickel transport system permease protein